MSSFLTIATIGFGASLALALWRLVEEVRKVSKLRSELKGVIDHARGLESKYKRAAERNAGYQAIVRKLKEGLDKKNDLLEKHGVGARDVLDGMLSDEGGET